MGVHFRDAQQPPKTTKKKNHHEGQWQEFLALDSPHPNGVKPSGNLLFEENTAAKDFGPNHAFFRQIKDESWMSVLGFLDGVSMGYVVQTCRFFYVSGSSPELWRDLVLRKKGSNEAIRIMGDSWKDTFVLDHTGLEVLECPSKPMKIPGIYSDDLYRLHTCRAFAMPKSWAQQEPISTDWDDLSSGFVPRVRIEDLTCENFVQHFENRNRPVVIDGAAKTWKAFREWKNPEYLRSHTEGRTFRATSGMAPLPANFTMPAYQKYCENQLEEAPLYLFDREALQPGSPLHNDFFADLQQTCPYFDPARTMHDGDQVGHDLFQVLGEGKRPDHTWGIFGGSHSGSVFHIDPNATHAWNASIVGRKRWIFYPPDGQPPPGVFPSRDGDEVALPLSLGEWILTFFREHQDRKKTNIESQRPLECTAFPGDVVFVPHGWWHAVINMDDVNIAITHNYVSRSNLSNVLRFLKLKEDQISGCRDRVESIKPEQLHSSFLAALQNHFDDAEWLVAAKEQAKNGWTCKAWQAEEEEEELKEQQKKRSLENIVGVTTYCHQRKKQANSGTSVMVKAKSSSSMAGNAPFSFSFL